MRRMKSRLARYRASCRTMCRTIGIVSGRPRDNGPVGGPFGGGAGMYRSPLDTLGVRTNGTGQASSFVGWALIAYATGMSLWGA